VNFAGFLRNTYAYFGKKQDLPRATGILWENECGHYPDPFFDWAFQQVKASDSGKNFLANPPKAVHEYWQQWLRANPQKVEHKGFSCQNPYCKGGWFAVYERDRESGTLTKRLAPCAECKSLGSAMLHGMTRGQAVSRGYLLPEPEVGAEHTNRQQAMIDLAWEKSATQYGGRS
jgi:hypothetical protein